MKRKPAAGRLVLNTGVNVVKSVAISIVTGAPTVPCTWNCTRPSGASEGMPTTGGTGGGGGGWTTSAAATLVMLPTEFATTTS